MLKEFDERLKEKDNEISTYKNQAREFKAKYEDIASKADQINEDRAKIAGVLIKAQEKADSIIEDAKTQAMEEKKRLEEIIEREREKLVDIKAELKVLKSEVVNTLKKYEAQLGDIIEEPEE